MVVPFCVWQTPNRSNRPKEWRKQSNKAKMGDDMKSYKHQLNNPRRLCNCKLEIYAPSNMAGVSLPPMHLPISKS